MGESAETSDKVKRPHSWEKAVLVAYLLSRGRTQKEAADEAGCSERVIRDWIGCSWWSDAKAEGIERWNSEIVTLAREAIRDALKDPDEAPGMARYVADRMIPELAPPKNRMEHSLSHEHWLDAMDAEPGGDGEAT